jgi:hypothetical protein
MTPSAPPRFQAAIETAEEARRRASETTAPPAQVELVAKAQRRRRRGLATTAENPPDVPVGMQRPTRGEVTGGSPRAVGRVSAQKRVERP